MSVPESSTRAVDTPTSRSLSTTERDLMVGALILITTGAFEAMAVINAMPTVVKYFGPDQWFALVSGIAIAMQVVSTVVAGWLADHRGVGVCLYGGLTLFALGALAAGLAPSLVVFAFARALQGIGGGLIIVPLYVLIGALVPASKRPRFFAAFSYAWVVPSMVGPALSGWIITHFSWRIVFLISLPMAALSIVPLVRSVNRTKVAKKDWDNFPKVPMLAGIGFATAITVWQVAGGFTDAKRWLAVVAAGVLLVVALRYLLPAGALKAVPGIPAIISTRLLIMASMIGAEAFVPLVLERVHHWHPLQTGLGVAMGTITWTIGSWLQARITVPKKRRSLPFIGTGLVLTGAVVAMTLPWVGIHPVVGLIGWSITGLGMGLAVATTSDLVLSMADQSQHGQVSSALQVADSVGPALSMGIAALALSVTMGMTPVAAAGTWWSAVVFLPASALAVVTAAAGLLAAKHIHA
ncbi:MAG: MFS transporter [Actinomycetaceae bacterium]|nr:MFS transporter [Actinomycetaceae bacterium]